MLLRHWGQSTRTCGIPALAGPVPHQKVDAHANLNAEDVVGRAGQLRVLPDVAAQVEHVDGIEVFRQILAHPVARDGVEKTAVGDQGDDAFLADPVRSPADGFDVGIGELVAERGLRVSRVCGGKGSRDR